MQYDGDGGGGILSYPPLKMEEATYKKLY